jgi:hypothetical protein
MIAALGVPVGLIDYAWNGSGLTVLASGGQWVPVSNPPYANANAYVQSLDGRVAGWMWNQGESDADAASSANTTQAAYYASARTLFAQARADMGAASMPIVLATLAKRTDGVVPNIDVGTEAIRNAQVQLCADPYIYRVDREDIPLDTDNVQCRPQLRRSLAHTFGSKNDLFPKDQSDEPRRALTFRNAENRAFLFRFVKGSIMNLQQIATGIVIKAIKIIVDGQVVDKVVQLVRDAADTGGTGAEKLAKVKADIAVIKDNLAENFKRLEGSKLNFLIEAALQYVKVHPTAETQVSPTPVEERPVN